MTLFHREANFIREIAYSSFKQYRYLWGNLAAITDEDVDYPEANRAYERAANLQAVADFIDPQNRYSFWERFKNEHSHLYK